MQIHRVIGSWFFVRQKFSMVDFFLLFCGRRRSCARTRWSVDGPTGEVAVGEHRGTPIVAKRVPATRARCRETLAADLAALQVVLLEAIFSVVYSSAEQSLDLQSSPSQHVRKGLPLSFSRQTMILTYSNSKKKLVQKFCTTLSQHALLGLARANASTVAHVRVLGGKGHVSMLAGS